MIIMVIIALFIALDMSLLVLSSLYEKERPALINQQLSEFYLIDFDFPKWPWNHCKTFILQFESGWHLAKRPAKTLRASFRICTTLFVRLSMRKRI